MQYRQGPSFIPFPPHFGRFIPSQRIEDFLYSIADPDAETRWLNYMQYVADASFHSGIADRLSIPGACAFSVVSTAVNTLLPNFLLTYSVRRTDGDYTCHLDGFTIGRVRMRVETRPLHPFPMAA